MGHTWTEDDDVIGYYLYRFGDIYSTFTKQEIAESRGISWASMSFKIGNFEYLDTNGRSGLSGYSTQAERIYNKFKEMPDIEFATLSKRKFSLLEVEPSSDLNTEELEKKIQKMQAAIKSKEAKLKKLRGE